MFTNTLLLNLFLDILDIWAIHIFFLFTFYTLANKLPAFIWLPSGHVFNFLNSFCLRWIIFLFFARFIILGKCIDIAPHLLHQWVIAVLHPVIIRLASCVNETCFCTGTKMFGYNNVLTGGTSGHQAHKTDHRCPALATDTVETSFPASE